jgi:hypothetical protein
MMRELVDCAGVGSLARVIAEADAHQFVSRYPADTAYTAGETRKALDALHSDPDHRRRYAQFVAAMVYGEEAVFDRPSEQFLRWPEG